jgi:hypothetical protein
VVTAASVAVALAAVVAGYFNNRQTIDASRDTQVATFVQQREMDDRQDLRNVIDEGAVALNRSLQSTGGWGRRWSRGDKGMSMPETWVAAFRRTDTVGLRLLVRLGIAAPAWLHFKRSEDNVAAVRDVFMSGAPTRARNKKSLSLREKAYDEFVEYMAQANLLMAR